MTVMMLIQAGRAQPILGGMSIWTRMACVVAGAAGCSPGTAVESQVSIRDSADVQIVENFARAWSEGEQWVISPVPLLSIGAVDGSPDYLLSVVAGTVRMSDGRIAVADAGSSSIRFYGTDGRFLSRSGRHGQGPGEYADIARLSRIAADTLVVADGVLQRITFLDSTGAYVRSIGLKLTEGYYDVGFYNVMGVLEDGTIMAYAGSGGGFRESDAGRLIVNTMHFFWFHRTGEYGGKLTDFPGAPRWGLRTALGVSFPFVPFAGRPVSSAGLGRLVVGPGTEAALHVFDSTGRFESIIRWPGARPVASAEMERLREELLGEGRTPDQRRINRQLLAEAPLPDALPATQAVLVDRLGYIWVEPYRAPGELQPAWEVFDPAGRWLGSVWTPPELRIYEIGRDYVLGVWRDDLNVEYVRAYPLRRSGA